MTIFDDPATAVAFSVFQNRGVFALLLGSGISRAAEIPTGWEITTDLIRRIALMNGTGEQADWGAWYTELEGEEPNYSKLLTQLAPTREERRAILNAYIEPTEEDLEEGRKVPTKAHRAIAELVQRGFIKVIITTNFDRLLENALRELGVEPTVVSSADGLKDAEPITHTTCFILKLHGDYKDTRILNTEPELEIYPDSYSETLDRIFDEYGLLVCGWSGEWDPALRQAILRASNRRYPTFWAVRGEPGEHTSNIADSRQARVIPIIDADTFFVSLSERVKTLEETRADNPMSIDLLVRMTKRYLSGPEYRIQLADLLTTEMHRLLDRLEASDLPPHGSADIEEFRRRVRLYESASEALAKILGILGRWGMADSNEVAVDVVTALLAYADEPNGGTVRHLELRAYPAVLAFTAYGLGLVRAKRWKDLRSFLEYRVGRRFRDEPMTLVSRLFQGAWEGANRSIWNQFKGDGKNWHTPFSDHLCDEVFKNWAQVILGSTHNFVELFEYFEILASMSYLSNFSKEALTQTINSGQGQYKWMPFGRSCWNREIREKLLATLAENTISDELLEAGFFHGDREFLILSVKNYRNLCEEISWR